MNTLTFAKRLHVSWFAALLASFTLTLAAPGWAQEAPPPGSAVPPSVVQEAPGPTVVVRNTVHTERAAAPGQVGNGFVFGASVGGQFNVIGSISFVGAATPINDVQVGIFGGVKLGRFIFGAGLSFNNVTTTTSAPAGSMTGTNSAFLITPEVMIAILRSADERVELLGDASLGLGGSFGSNTTTAGGMTASGSQSGFRLSYQVGPGVRFWAHPHFAIQALGGFSGLAIFPITNPMAMAPAATSTTVSVHGIFGSIGLLGVF